MSETEKFRHDRSAYERPGLPFRCGRATAWGQPCWQGPDWRGHCGGESECTPIRSGDRWECRRPVRAGGPCAQGPLPDGRCCSVRPPCQPQPTLRRFRGRIGLLVMGAVIAVLVAFSNPGSSLFASVAALDPGPLSRAHSGFIGPQNCAACHDGHDASGIGWWAKVFESHDNDSRCLQCHAFDGPDRLAHNREFAPERAVAQPDCGTCHQEHNGAGFDLTAVSDVTCSNCHTQQFKSFAEGHPEFPQNFPYQVPNAVYFDHRAHIERHFDKTASSAGDDKPALERFARRAARDCTACHEVETASREVRPRSYEQTCAACHDEQITSRPLFLMFADDVTLAGTLLLGVSDEDAQAEEKMGAWREALAENGLSAFEPLFEAWSIERGAQMLDGLTPEMVQAATRAWTAETDYEPPETDIQLNGWRAGEDADGNQSLRYEPRGHRDNVVRTWFDVLAVLAASQEDEGRRELAAAALERLMDPSTGPGACGKCHAAGITALNAKGEAEPHWPMRGSVERRHTSYAHAPHLNLLGRGDACRNCHVVDAKADYAAYFEDAERQASQFVSNFSPIGKATCDSCHKPDKVRFDCQLCHTYHRDPSFNVGFQVKRLAPNE